MQSAAMENRVLKGHMYRKVIPKTKHLMPLSNDECRTAATHLEPDEREVYDIVKELISRSSESAEKHFGRLRGRRDTIESCQQICN